MSNRRVYSPVVVRSVDPVFKKKHLKWRTKVSNTFCFSDFFFVKDDLLKISK